VELPVRLAPADPLREGGRGLKPASFVAAVALDLVAAAHLARIVLHTEVTVGGRVVPMWVSGVGCVVAATLSFLVLLEARSKRS
jgi:hypothetical protein